MKNNKAIMRLSKKETRLCFIIILGIISLFFTTAIFINETLKTEKSILLNEI